MNDNKEHISDTILKELPIIEKKCYMTCLHHNHSFPESFFLNDEHEIKSKCGRSNKASSICNNDECEHCFYKSFASHFKAQYWNYEKNENIDYLCPRMIMKGSRKINIWFSCYRCPHNFSSILNNITKHKKSTWCPYCCEGTKLLCKDMSCYHCYNNSFASHKKSKHWDYKLNNNLSSRMVTKGNSKDLFWFKCHKCPHYFDTQTNHIINGNWCRYCSPYTQYLCEDINCIFCWNKSFASSPMVIYYSQENKEGNKYIKPRTLCKNSSKPYKFVCDNGHNFEIVLYAITNGQFCGLCKNKTEGLVYTFLYSSEGLEKILGKGFKITKQPRYEWCISFNDNKTKLPFDFEITYTNETLNIVIRIIFEIDGPHHEKQISNWRSHKETQEIDFYKMDKANENGYTIIRIRQEDIWHDRINWKEEILRHIHAYKKPCRVYILNSFYSIYREYDMRNSIVKLVDIVNHKSSLFNSYEELALLINWKVDTVELMVNNYIIHKNDFGNTFKIKKINKKRKLYKEMIRRLMN